MARYYVPADHDLATVARELLDKADDHRTVVYLPGEGPNGAFDLPDDLADSYTSKQAAKVQADNDKAADDLRDADAAVRRTPGPDEPTTEDLRTDGQKTNVVQGTYETPKRATRRTKTTNTTANQE